MFEPANTKHLPIKALALLPLCLLFLILHLQMVSVSKTSNHCLRSGLRGGNTLDSLWEGSNTAFASAGTCDHCHGSDASGIASVDAEGTDINVVDAWSSTMMANSAIDPYWRAKVSEEVLLHPNLQAEIENTCTKCHAPLGHYAHTHQSQEPYSIAHMMSDPVALDGVSCLACHSQLPQTEVAQHSGKLFMDYNHMAYGPYTEPLITPMALYSGYTPEFGNHITDSKLCAGCHSLVTETVNLQGNLTGDHFVEQATWHEWLNSSYPSMGISCQKCHLPTAEGQEVVLAVGYNTPPRSPYGLHTMAGGNTLMLKLLRDNRTALNIFASEQQFNKTIDATLDMLQNQSLLVNLLSTQRTADSLFVDVRLTNKTGHKLPSGYPARKMSVFFTCKTSNGNVVFRSGGFDANQYILGEDLPFEPHHNTISNPQQVQIYEMVMGDVNLQRTNVLNRGYTHLKDNRLVPLGHSESIAGADTTKIVLGTTDADFNFAATEGSGTDIIHYRIPLNGITELLSVEVEVYYQSLPPTFTEQLFGLQTPAINAFRDMMEVADKSPVLMATAGTSVDAYTGIDLPSSSEPFFFMNNQTIRLYNAQDYTLKLFDNSGKLILEQIITTQYTQIPANLPHGMYVAVLHASQQRRLVKKILIE